MFNALNQAINRMEDIHGQKKEADKKHLWLPQCEIAIIAAKIATEKWKQATCEHDWLDVPCVMGQYKHCKKCDEVEL